MTTNSTSNCAFISRSGKTTCRFATIVAAIIIMAAMGLPCAFASGPDNQYGYKTPIVRIYAFGVVNPEFQGTGTVIDNMEVILTNVVAGITNYSTNGYFCILTADHVICDGCPNKTLLPFLSVAFGDFFNVNSAGQTVNLPRGGNLISPAVPIGRGGPSGDVDIALLSVYYGDYNAAYDVHVMKVAGGPTVGLGDLFSSAGYGARGIRLEEAQGTAPGIEQNSSTNLWTGYQRKMGTNVYEEQRFYYNSVSNLVFLANANAYPPNVDPYPYPGPETNDLNKKITCYKYDAIFYDNTMPTLPAAVPGEGVSFDADSGAPYMDWDGVENTVIGVHTRGGYSDNFRTIKRWGVSSFGVQLTAANEAWVLAQCATNNPPPEPPSPFLQARISGGNFLLAWPTSSLGFTLISTHKLTPPIQWSTVTNGAVISNGQYNLTAPVANTNTFFRLTFP